ncbi:MAG TPA: GNAT family N-acetyltransferase [Trueperaceae bacterium]|nr:GNAT family N-acetyltransferase [Trueperaceae bacterium]
MTAEDSTESLVHLVPWGPEDLPLLEKLLGDPQMMVHLGGPESLEKIRSRQKRYEDSERLGDSSKDRTLKIEHTATGAGAGWVGYWESRWRNEQVYEIGWSVLPAFQGRGIATAAAAQALHLLRSAARHRHVHAFPAVDNHGSNAVCRRLGFELVGECQVEYPPGQFIRGNDWRLELLGG